jgi:phosphohistidine phosphatase
VDLYLIRHAEAKDKTHEGVAYADDAERPLTEAGRQAARALGRALKERGERLGGVWTSPLVRAVETAELVCVELGFEGALDVSPLLEPGGRVRAIREQLIERSALASMALVGHEPSMGKLLSDLLGQDGLSLKKGAAVKLRYEESGVRLVYTLKPS